jgi:GT2 family glycosyltransferase
MLCRNNLELSKRAANSVMGQDVETELFVIDNDSTDGTQEWLHKDGIAHATFRPQLGVSVGWNYGLQYLFRLHDHVLVINNDVVLPPWFYGELLSYDDVPFVTGVAVDVMPEDTAPYMPLTPNPDFSAFLIHRHAWDVIGQFSGDMKFYASDCDYHIRGHRLGIPMMKANVPYYHESSSTLKLASQEERDEINRQADADRQTFRNLYGCVPGEPEYDSLFK